MRLKRMGLTRASRASAVSSLVEGGLFPSAMLRVTWYSPSQSHSEGVDYLILARLRHAFVWSVLAILDVNLATGHCRVPLRVAPFSGKTVSPSEANGFCPIAAVSGYSESYSPPNLGPYLNPLRPLKRRTSHHHRSSSSNTLLYPSSAWG